jgi:hypothetical protein
MSSPATITTEQPSHPLASGNDRFNLIPPLNGFSEGNPILVEITPCSDIGQIGFTVTSEDSSLLLDSTLSAQPSHQPAIFLSKSNDQVGS